MIIVSVYNSAVPKLHKLITFTFEYNLGIYIVMFRLMIVRMRPESGNSTYVTGRRPTRALEVQ